MGWINVGERLPTHGDGVVLVAIDSYDCGWVIDAAWYYAEEQEWVISGCHKQCRAHMPYTHWMPLPEPPRDKDA